MLGMRMGINKSNQLQRVRNGLVLYLDSKDFANSPPTSTHRDRSGNGNNATPTGFAYTTLSGADGKGGLVFDGINDVLTAAHSNSLSFFSGDLTIEVVIKGTNLATTETILGKSLASGISAGYGINLRNTAPYVKFFIYDTAVKGTTVCNTDIRDGKRHVIQCVKSGGNFKLYIDNVLISNDTLSVGAFTNLQPLYIGQNYNNGTPNNFLKSTVYMIAMYSRALTDSELNLNYNVSK